MTETLNSWIDFLEKIDINKINLGLDRMQLMLRELKLTDYLKDALVIEVAGTNGKGSCASFLSECLKNSRVSVGLYTSPHLKHFTERVRINGKEVAEELLCDAFAKVKEAASRTVTPLTYFEFTTLAALICFAKAKLKALVLEIGLGGRLDAVNAVDANVCLIPSIGFDHMAYLGNTLGKIAFEKAGIIKPQSIVIAGELEAEALEVVQGRAKELNCRFYDASSYLINRNTASLNSFKFAAAALGVELLFDDYRIPKACVGPALMAACVLKKHFDIDIPDEVMRKALVSAALPCRMESVKFNFSGSAREVILDVAHNVPAAVNLRNTLEDRFGKTQPIPKMACVVGMLKDKDIEGVLKVMTPLFSHFYTSSLDGVRGEQAQRLSAAISADKIPKAKIKSYNKVSQALQAALDDGHEQVLVFGSFHTASAARDFLQTLDAKG